MRNNQKNTDKPNKIAHPHDAGFKSAMSDVRVARDILRHHLPQEIQKKINLNTLKLSSGTFVDAELQTLETDILYTVQLADNTDKALVYALVEQQTDPDRLMPWRMIKYCVRIIEQHLKKTNTKTLPLIIPLVIYNGNRIYPYSANVFDLFGENKALAEKFMFKSFHLIDLNTIPDEEIRQYEWSALLEMLLKHIRVRDIMSKLEQMEEIFQHLLKLQAEDYVLSMLKYIIERANIEDRAAFLAWVKENLPPKLETTAMTLAEQWKSEGVQIGMQQGMQQGIQQGELRGEKKLLKNLASIKFGKISEEQMEKIEHADAGLIFVWSERILTAKTIDEVFNSFH